MIDRLVHHAEVISLRGNSYRPRDRDLGRVPRSHQRRPMTNQWVSFRPSLEGQLSTFGRR